MDVRVTSSPFRPLITCLSQIRRVIMEKGTWKVALPGLASVSEIKEDVKLERHLVEQPFN